MCDTQWHFTKEPGVLKKKKQQIKWVQYQPRGEVASILPDNENTIKNEGLNKNLCQDPIGVFEDKEDSSTSHPTPVPSVPEDVHILQSPFYLTDEYHFSVPYNSKSSLISSTLVLFPVIDLIIDSNYYPFTK